MKVKFSVTTFLILCILGIGIYYMAVSSVNRYQSHHPKNLAEVSVSDLKAGDFVELEVDSYLVSQGRNGKNSGVSSTYITENNHSYHVYIVPVADGKYVCLMARSDTEEELLTFSQGQGQSLTLYGQLIDYDAAGENADWYQGLADFDQEDLIQGLAMFEIDRAIYDGNVGISVTITSTGIWLLLADILMKRQRYKKDCD